jgi:simple sugar transport system ATP-binding protein
MPYIRMQNISKKFGAVYANQGLDFEIYKGEIHALLGENGSGKTTLMNILTGKYARDSGEIFQDGRPVTFKSPADSLKAGIGIIHQHVDLAEVLSVEENIAVGAGTRVFTDKKQLRREIREMAEQFRFPIEPGKKLYQLSVGEKQTVEILKTFYRGVSTLILDEPTSVLTPSEALALFENLRNLREQGRAVVLITHKMDEVFAISDRVTVLRKGARVFSAFTKDTDRKELTLKMVGRDIERDRTFSRRPAERQTPVLSVRNLTVKDRYGVKALDGVDFSVHPGEIHGVAGVLGSGQRELCDAVAGMIKPQSGEILFKETDIAGLSPRRRKRRGIRIGYVPEDRMRVGLVGAMSLADNLMLRRMDEQKGLFLDTRKNLAWAETMMDRYGVSAAGPNQPLRELSGGNIQKTLLGREIETGCALIVAAYPMRGLDIGASDSILDMLAKEREKGAGILFAGEDLDLLLEICDRISVLHAGRLAAVLDAGATNKTEIGFYMTGHTGTGVTM